MEASMKILKGQEAPLQKMIELLALGKTDEEIIEQVNKEHNTMFLVKSRLLKEAKRYHISSLKVPDKEFFLKDSLIQYEEIKDESKVIDDRGVGLKIQLTALKDRNELIGLQNSNPVVEINFNSDVSDAEFLFSQNKKKDIIDGI